jgi:DNA repair exonuclease SbcCD nuclease subunit
MRVLHLADAHLDRPFVGLPLGDARERRTELRAAMERALGLASEIQADVITIGGDLWEDEHITPDTCKWVAEHLAMTDLPVCVVAGNHDPLRPGGPYRRTEWPENVHIFPAEANGLSEFRLGALSIWGTSWGPAPLRAEWLDAFKVPDDGRAHVLLLHGTSGAAAFQEGAHCPFTAQAVRASGFQLCLAGHLHAAGVREDTVVYPGSLEPLTWDETGSHGVAIVQISLERPPDVELRELNRRRYAERSVNCDGAQSSADVQSALDEAIALALVELGEGLCLRISLEGRIAVDCEIDLPALSRRGSALAMLEIRDQTKPAFDLDALAEGHTALATFVEDMRARLAAAQPGEHETLTTALELGLRAMHGDWLPHAD